MRQPPSPTGRPLRVLFCAALLSASLAVAGSRPARAQTPSPFAYWQNAAGVVLTPLGGPVPEWSVALGGGFAYQPVFEGLTPYRLLPAPLIDVRYRDIAFVSTGDGAGVNIISGDTYRAGVALGYDVGRSQHITGRLNGVGSIDPSPDAKIFGEIAFLPVIISADVRQRILAHGGYVGDLGVYMPVVGTEELVIFVGPSLTFADGRYMRAYFGIAPDQAAPHSHFKEFAAHGGLKNANFGVTTIYHFTEQWFVDVDLGLERLLGSALQSPITQNRYQIGLAATVGYQF